MMDSRHRRRGVASIPGKMSLNVQLGPAADDDDNNNDSGQQQEQHYHRRLRTPGGPARASYRQATVPQLAPPPQQQQQQQQQRVRWSRMAVVAAQQPQQQHQQPPPPPSPPMLGALASSASAAATNSASLCQLVDFGETRDLIRRQREATKKLAEVTGIVSHLGLDSENSQDQFERSAADGWSTFRPQTNSQFKQYVFQSPGRAPQLPAPSVENPMRRSRTTLGLQAASSVDTTRRQRHIRPDALGALARRQDGFFSRESTFVTATPRSTTMTSGGQAMPTIGSGGWTLQRASSNLQLGADAAATLQPRERQQRRHHLWTQGNSGNSGYHQQQQQQQQQQQLTCISSADQ